jgi:hypothetical protein
MKKRIIAPMAVAIGMALMASCASKKEGPVISTTDNTQKFDKQLNFNTTDGEKVGVRGDQVVIQKRSYVEQELARLQGEVQDLQDSIYGKSVQEPSGLWAELKDCRGKLSDPRIGGSGTPDPMEHWENVTERADDNNYVVDKHDSVVAVSEEGVDARLVRYRKYKVVLTDRYQDFKDKVDSCHNRYKVALVNHGLKPEDTQSSGQWVDGPNGYKVWQMRRPSTDDPEELARRKMQGQ